MSSTMHMRSASSYGFTCGRVSLWEGCVSVLNSTWHCNMPLVRPTLHCYRTQKCLKRSGLQQRSKMHLNRIRPVSRSPCRQATCQTPVTWARAAVLHVLRCVVSVSLYCLMLSARPIFASRTGHACSTQLACVRNEYHGTEVLGMICLWPAWAQGRLLPIW